MQTPGMIKTRLLLKKAELEAGFNRTQKAGHSKGERVRADVAKELTQTEADAVFYSLDQEALAELAQIGRALKRLEEGEYTKCSCCSLPINERRLKAFPTTDLCFICADLT